MSYKLQINEDNIETIQELLRIQTMSDEALENNETVMVRLHQFDLGRLWEKLDITPCLVCYHGNKTSCNQGCRWFSRCTSSVKAGQILEEDGNKFLEVSLNFEIQ